MPGNAARGFPCARDGYFGTFTIGSLHQVSGATGACGCLTKRSPYVFPGSGYLVAILHQSTWVQLTFRENADPTSIWVEQQIVEAFADREARHCLIRLGARQE